MSAKVIPLFCKNDEESEVADHDWRTPDDCDESDPYFRDVMANILLDAVNDSFLPGGEDAREWLNGKIARDAFLYLDICPDVAMASLQEQWDAACMEHQMGLFDTVH